MGVDIKMRVDVLINERENKGSTRVRIRKEWIIKYYPHPVLLLGPPGVGKSETVRRVADLLAEGMRLELVEYDGRDVEGDVFLFYDLRLTEVEPSELIGVPREENGYMVYKPPKWAVLFSRHPGVLFLDELTNVQREDVIAVAYKLLDGKAGEVRFHPGVWVVAAGNRPEDSVISRLLPAPLMNRLIRVDFDAPRLDEWISYMNAVYGEWDRRVAAYLGRFPDDFIRPPLDAAETLENFPTPRSWTKLACMLPSISRGDGLNPHGGKGRRRGKHGCRGGADGEAVAALCRGLLGEEVADKFLTFIGNPTPSVAEVIRNPELFDGFSIDQKYIFSVMFAEWLSRRVGERVRAALPLLRHLTRHREMLMFVFSSLREEVKGDFFRVLVKSDRETFFPVFREAGNLIARSVDWGV
nr:AAA family ATPase [Candidatus Freyrarchaeum guaymaensis]